MKVVAVSNFLSPHQQPLSEAIALQKDVEYRFIETEVIPAERVRLGYQYERPDYTLQAYEKKERLDICNNWVIPADVVIAGSSPEELLRKRIYSKRLTFRYSERPLKRGTEYLKFFPRLLRWNFRNPKFSPVYLLCASAFSAGDYRKFGLFHNRCYKWGYFPETRRYNDENQLFSSKDPLQILWCGRFLGWKHPLDAIKIAKRLKMEGIPFKLNMIGGGPEDVKLRQVVTDEKLDKFVSFMGTMTPEQVRDHMEHAGLFLFTSDAQEGWGAVLNEAMNSGCAVIASDAIGAVPYLMQDTKNGVVYHSGNLNELAEKTIDLLQNPKKQRTLGKAAYHTIRDLWNAEIAAKRFIQLSKAILAGNSYPDLFCEGPCSRAEIISEDWFISNEAEDAETKNS